MCIVFMTLLSILLWHRRGRLGDNSFNWGDNFFQGVGMAEGWRQGVLGVAEKVGGVVDLAGLWCAVTVGGMGCDWGGYGGYSLVRWDVLW